MTVIATLWNNKRVRTLLYQLIVITLLVVVGYYLMSNMLFNLEERSIHTGFQFLNREAGFHIGETLIPYTAEHSYARAFFVGILNTLKVAVLGIVLSTFLGVFIGLMRLSSNWLVAKIATVYVEAIRNVPVLLQIFFWYAVTVNLLPAVNNALNPLPGVYLSKSGLAFPTLVESSVYLYILIAFLVGCVLALLLRRFIKKYTWLFTLGCIVGLPLLAWIISGASLTFSIPVPARFNIQGGTTITPEFIALLVSLSMYTGAFIAENVRAGIQAVPKGQTEAAFALGLKRSTVTRLIVLPQALRIIIPPTISQYLNVTKNSSLAVAIGYPDLVSVTNTSLNQTGQAIECIAIMMSVYLAISLSISVFMNWYNRHVALVGVV